MVVRNQDRTGWNDQGMPKFSLTVLFMVGFLDGAMFATTKARTDSRDFILATPFCRTCS